ncbi:MAG: hypothetical protein VW338_08285 [Rhodospirillaceae bacterium]
MPAPNPEKPQVWREFTFDFGDIDVFFARQLGAFSDRLDRVQAIPPRRSENLSDD